MPHHRKASAIFTYRSGASQFAALPVTEESETSGEVSGERITVRRFNLNKTHSSPEELGARITELTCERERLRKGGAARDVLERNRLEIVRCQYELSYALVERFLTPSGERAA